jgi:uncharacterized protein (TIGR02271 family)
MQNNTTFNTPRDSASTGAMAHLCRLDDLDDFTVADGDPDVRGWDVRTADGRKAGKVDDLVVDTNAMQVRYLDVELDRDELSLDNDRHVLVPIANARLDDDNDDVLLGSMTAAQVMALQPFEHGQPIGTNAAPAVPATDPGQFYGKRGGTGAVQRMTLSEEQLRVGKRTTEAGGVDVRKTVDTEHVSRQVPVMHEEVSIERRALAPDADTTARIAEDEVHIPLTAEEAVVEKRAVAREEVVITKKMVEGEQTVEADLRKERVDVDRNGVPGKPH